MKQRLLSLTTLALAMPLLLTACSPAEEPVKEDTKSEQKLTREDQPEEVNAIENSEGFYAEIEDFIDLTKFEDDWLQLAPMAEVDENSISKVWFAVVESEKAIDISNFIISDKGWTSTKDSAPQTAEEQAAQAGVVIEEDPLDMSGVIYLEDGSSMTISSTLDESTGQSLVHYMFSVNRA